MDLLPKFPRTKHAPICPSATRDDLIATEKEWEDAIKTSPHVFIEEKLDGANSGIVIVDNCPVIRNRNHVLNKAKGGKTPAKRQFAPIWNWAYENIAQFKTVYKELGFCVSIYGEWLYACHSVKYDALPSYFIAYDLYDIENGKFICPATSRSLLQYAGFITPQLLSGFILSDKEMISLRDRKSSFSSEIQEGLYIKFSDGEWLTDRFKMVRPGFIQGEHWNEGELVKNVLSKL